ncbi:MAG: exo-alpha-sialidase, partial [Ignavibacteriae bacterium]
MKKISVFLTILVLFSSVISAQDNARKKLDASIENGWNVVSGYVYKYAKTQRDLIDPPNTVPFPPNYYDYVTNGNNLRQFWIHGDTVIVAVDRTDSASAQTSNARRSYYQVSYDGGNTWLTDALQVSTEGTAYPNIYLVNIGSDRTVAMSGRAFEGTTQRGYGGFDLTLGIGSVSSGLVPEPGRDYFAYKLNNTHLVGSYQGGDTVISIKYNFTNNTFSDKVIIASPPDEVGVSARTFSVCADNGQNVFIMWWHSVSPTKLIARESNNGGTSYGSTVTIITEGLTINGDAVAPWFGADIIYKPGTTTICAAFNTLAPGNFSTAQGSKLLFWSPAINNGTPVNIADRTNYPLLQDTGAFNNRTTELQVGMTAVSHPSLAYSTDGSRLICVYSGMQADTSSYNFAFNDIYVSYSDNNGATWSTPRNLTNTPNIDEIYPVISKTGNTQNNIGITFKLSEFPGATSFTNTTTPISLNYQIFRRYDPVTGNPIGINTISNEVPQSFKLHQNYPNPFNPSTKIRFELPKSEVISLKIYDLLGKEVAAVVN